LLVGQNRALRHLMFSVLMSLEIGISSAILRRRMAFISRIFTPGRDHFFLLGPRGTGKTLWSTHRYPRALRIDLLDPETLRCFPPGQSA
jgi:hypothetical protein